MLGPELFAYGPAPGMELIPYFLGLLAWAGLTFVTVLLWPLTVLLRRFRKARHAPQVESKPETTTPSVAESSATEPR